MSASIHVARIQTTEPQPAGTSAGPALRTFFRIASAWKLSVAQQMQLLGLDTRSTFYNWKKAPGSAQLSPEKYERLSYIFGIYKALQILLPDAAAADRWVHECNTARPFGGQPAIERMTSGLVADLYEVRKYLDAQRGW